MTIAELRNALDAQPFRAFILHTADGRSLPVPPPDFVHTTLGGRTLIVNSLVDDGFAIIDLLLVPSLEIPANGIEVPNPESTQKT